MEKVSLIVTVLNEESSIGMLLESVAEQKHLPNEIIIVDGGSSDKTSQIVKDFFRHNMQLNGKLLSAKGSIAHGRNVAIDHARYDIIAVTDAGCVLDKNWLQKLAAAFSDNSIYVAAGFYIPTGSSVFQKCLGVYMSVMKDRIDPANFLPSSRSVAFRKDAWKKIGGYPEYLQTAEDLVFAKNLKSAGFSFVTVLNAYVMWPQKKTYWQAFWQFFRYAQGDGKAFYIRRQTPLLFIRVFGAIAFVGYTLYVPTLQNVMLASILAVVYVVWAVYKNIQYVPYWRSCIHLPLLQIVSDIAVTLGMISGFIQRYA